MGGGRDGPVLDSPPDRGNGTEAGLSLARLGSLRRERGRVWLDRMEDRGRLSPVPRSNANEDRR